MSFAPVSAPLLSVVSFTLLFPSIFLGLSVSAFCSDDADVACPSQVPERMNSDVSVICNEFLLLLMKSQLLN